MKKKLFMTLFLVFGLVGISNAQLQEGNLMLGTDLGSGLASSTSNGLFSMNFGFNEGAGFNIGVSPRLGYFFTDELVLGAIANVGFTKSPESNGESTKTTIYGVQGFIRFYISPGDVELEEVVRTGRFFFETNLGIAGVNVTDGPTTNGFAFGFGPGYSYFINESIALEASVKYNGLTGAGNTSYQESLGVNLGIQIFLPLSQAKDQVQNFD